MKKKSNEKGFILALIVLFMAVITTLLSVMLLNVSYPINISSAHRASKEQLRCLESIGRDFALDGKLDLVYEDYEVECDDNTELIVRNKKDGDLLLRVCLRDNKIIKWEYGEQ